MTGPDAPVTAATGLPLLETGCGLIVGFVQPDGAPLAGRAWGATVLDGGARVRVLVNATDVDTLGYPDGDLVGVMVAVTGGDVATYATVQVKGPVTAVEPATDTDRARMAAHCDAFFGNVEIVDNTPSHLMARLVPDAVAAIELEVADVFDQTPGPNAGTPLPGATR